MAKLVFSAITSLDLYVSDKSGRFDWAAPDPQVHAAVNDLERHVGTYLYGRRLYEVMQVWETFDTADQPPVIADYAAIWRAADKLVFSTSLDHVATPRTRLVRQFDPAFVRALKASAARDISIGGPQLAAAALRADLVDECHLFVHPIVVGGGQRALPDDLLWRLELLDEHRFSGGVVHLHYRSRG